MGVEVYVLVAIKRIMPAVNVSYKNAIIDNKLITNYLQIYVPRPNPRSPTSRA